MQTDTFKTLWKQQSDPRTLHTPETLRTMIGARWQDSRRSLVKRLSIELSMMMIVAGLVVWVTFFLVPQVTLFSMTFFGIACTLLVPSMAMFGFQIRKWSRLDFARDTRTQMRLIIGQHRRIVRIYIGLTYIFCIIMVLLLALWPFAESPPDFPYRVAFIAWCVIGIVLAKPYARWMFGRDADRLDGLLHELETIEILPTEEG